MIVREWRATATAAGADGYARHFAADVVPTLGALAGHRGAYLLRRDGEPGPGDVRITVITLWDSMDAVAGFAGADPGLAVVEPAAAAVLTDWDRTVRHHRPVGATPDAAPAPGTADSGG